MARKTIRISAAVVLLLAGSAAGAPDLQESHRACLQASSGGHWWYYHVRSSASGTTLDRWIINGAASYVDRNSYAAFHLPEGGRSAWDEGVAFAATMQTRNAWLNSEPINSATWLYNGDAGQDTMTWKTTVAGRPQDYIFRTSQCLNLSPPAPATDVPSEGQQPDTEAPAPSVLHACLEASSGGRNYFYEIHSDRANDVAGTRLDRYLVADGVDSLVDSNAFAALRQPDGNLPWNQGIQFTDAMQSRGVWINVEATKSATIEHDDASGEDTLTFRTTVNGAAQDYVFRSSQCRADVPSEGQQPDTESPCAHEHHCGHEPETDVPSEGQQPDTESPDDNMTDDNETEEYNTTEAPETDAPSAGQEPDTPAPLPVLHACLEASSEGHTYYYEVVSDPANDGAGTSFDRYLVGGGVDTFVDSNAFAALSKPEAGAAWQQGIQFADAMQSRRVWMNKEATMSATIEHDAVSGEDMLVFHTTVNGGLQDYIFRTSQCR
jgi:hypothetical protein